MNGRRTGGKTALRPRLESSRRRAAPERRRHSRWVGKSSRAMGAGGSPRGKRTVSSDCRKLEKNVYFEVRRPTVPPSGMARMAELADARDSKSRDL